MEKFRDWSNEDVQNKKYLIVYHQEDNDGVISAAIFYDYLMSKDVADCNIVLAPSTYSNINKNLYLTSFDLKFCDDYINSFDVVVFTDISMNNVKLFKQILVNDNFHTIWVDHHKPIIDAIYSDADIDAPQIDGIRTTEHSALLNMFNYLYPKQFTPQIYGYLSAWDSWTYKEFGCAKEFAEMIDKAITARLQLDFNKALEFVRINKDDPFDMKDNIFKKYYNEGKAIVNYLESVNNQMISNYGDFDWFVKIKDDKHKAIALFTQSGSSSTIFEKYKDEYAHGIVFKKKPNWGFSISLYNLRDDIDFDCGAYLKNEYNGGGHKGAAGCIITDEEFNKIINNKIL